MTNLGHYPDGDRQDADRFIEAVLGARLHFHFALGSVKTEEQNVRYGKVYKRWAQLYHRIYDPVRYSAKPGELTNWDSL